MLLKWGMWVFAVAATLSWFRALYWQFFAIKRSADRVLLWKGNAYFFWLVVGILWLIGRG